MKRLLFVSNLFPALSEPYRGLDNATLLHEMRGEFEVRVLSLRPSLPWARQKYLPRPEDVEFRPCFVRTGYIPKIGGSANAALMARSLRPAWEEAVRDFRPEVVLSSWIFPDACAVLRLAEDRVPVVAIAQGSDVHHYLRMPARRQVILQALPNAEAVITRSGELGRLLNEAGFPAEKLHTVYNGVDLETFYPGEAAASTRTILFVGNFYPVKDPLLLVRAHAELCQRSAPARLVMIGGGPLEGQARRLAGKLGSSDQVVFAGRKRPSEVAEWMRQADVLCVPSRNEGVPNVVLESFASGLPVVASRVGGIPEVLHRHELGRLVPAGDLKALAAALEAQLSAPRDSALIRRHGERFSWRNTAEDYKTILAEAIR